VVLVEVIPATKLPLNKPQRFTYAVADSSSAAGRTGRIVEIPLGQRSTLGVIVGTPKKKLPASIRVKQARPTSLSIPKTYLDLIERTAAIYRVSPGLIVKSMLSAGSFQPSRRKSRAADDATGNSATAAEFAPKVPTLSLDQQKAADALIKAIGSAKQFLLEGVTGSGKTEVYSGLAATLLADGKQVLMLVPEIAMATHLVERIQRYFGPHAVVWHSAMTPKTKYETWQRALSGEPLLLIGPRSALFVPLPNLGAIIMDEEHDGAYKQWDQEPRVHARVVAAELAKLASCPLVLGSATPSIETLAQSITRLQLPERFGGSPLPRIELVDRTGSPSDLAFAPASVEAIRDTLAQGLQVLVLINRRGAAPAVLCQQCGHIWRCKSCQRPLVWHVSPTTHLECHFCKTRAPLPGDCPECGSNIVRFFGLATQRVEAELKALFPAAKVARLDADISRSHAKLSKITEELASGKINILVGTQLVAKSWDIEKLHLVVILNADQGLLTADFRSHERTVQLLWQVAGRAGRRKKQGLVLIETMQPDHPALTAVVKHDYALFVMRELADRKKFGYPPFRHVVNLYQPLTKSGTLDQAHELGQKIVARDLTETDVLPARDQLQPRGKRIAVLTVVTPDPVQLYKTVPLDWSIDLDPESLIGV